MGRLLAIISGLLLSYAPALYACPGCKEPSNVNGSADVTGIGAGFSWSIFFMLAMVGGLLGGMLFMIVRACKALEAQQRSAPVVQSR
jgi:hypothetical protein